MSMLCENSIVAGNGSPRLLFFRYSTNRYGLYRQFCNYLDRLVHHADIYQIEGESYRKKHALKSNAQNRPS
ncbi:ATP-binding protein [Marinomonas sp. IMCC 4694]|uniref:ATP-binding protein n=1 Tax=Marinomonas sp. IMCC 4694 TaxID=2605432 RepID=UPI001CA34F36